MHVLSRIYAEHSCNIFMLSYSGYGLSEGQPDEKGVKIDAQVIQKQSKAFRNSLCRPDSIGFLKI